jgi:hypothetical protein
VRTCQYPPSFAGRPYAHSARIRGLCSTLIFQSYIDNLTKRDMQSYALSRCLPSPTWKTGISDYLRPRLPPSREPGADSYSRIDLFDLFRPTGLRHRGRDLLCFIASPKFSNGPFQDRLSGLRIWDFPEMYVIARERAYTIVILSIHVGHPQSGTGWHTSLDSSQRLSFHVYLFWVEVSRLPCISVIHSGQREPTSGYIIYDTTK